MNLLLKLERKVTIPLVPFWFITEKYLKKQEILLIIKKESLDMLNLIWYINVRIDTQMMC